MGITSKKFWTEGPGSFAVAIFVALVIRWAFLEAYVIPSGSMLPSLLINDHIFVNKLVYGIRFPFSETWVARFNEPQRGETIVFKYPENPSIFYIKRVVGVPGDRVFYEGGNLYINDELVEKVPPGKELAAEFEWLRNQDFSNEGRTGKSNYVQWEERLGEHPHSILLRKGQRVSPPFGPVTVPKDSYFVMGDNRDNSRDSRLWSPSKTFVPRELWVGRAAFVWLSCEEKLSKDIFVLSALCNPLTVRWKRFFLSVH